jgi:DNA-binding CsgD family transcriptional regulator
MGRLSEEQLLDLVYRTVVEPERWPTLLASVADLAGGEIGWLSQLAVADGSGGGVIARIDPAMLALYGDYYYQVNPFTKIADPAGFERRWRPSVRTDEAWMEKRQFERCEYYNDFLRPQNIHSAIVVGLMVSDGRMVDLNIGRSRGRGDFQAGEIEAIKRLHPHLVRAVTLSRDVEALRRERDDFAAVLDGCETAMFLVDRDGRILFANDAAERALARIWELQAPGRRLGLASPELTGALRRLIGLAATSDRPEGGSLAVPRGDGGRPLQIVVTPARSERLKAVSGEARAVVWLTDLERRTFPAASVLRALFCLSAAEAQVAEILATGASVAEAAELLDKSVHTVRSQLQRLLEKTGARRQSELIALFERLGR